MIQRFGFNQGGDSASIFPIHQSDSIGVSASLPLRAEPFSPEQTKNYFDGLLPEGYTRKTVAKWLHQEEDNYLRILAALGRECLGALKVTDADSLQEVPCSYEKQSLEQVRALAQEGATKSARSPSEPGRPRRNKCIR